MEVTTLLKGRGLRATRARAELLRVLLECSGPMMAEELKERCNLPLSTVYRVLSDLEENALAEKVYDEARGCARYTAQGRAPCCVLHCLGCDETVPVHLEAVERAAAETGRSLGFEPLSHRVEISGYCARCRQKRSSQPLQEGNDGQKD